MALLYADHMKTKTEQDWTATDIVSRSMGSTLFWKVIKKHLLVLSIKEHQPRLKIFHSKMW